jgi:hypothetical protein
MSTILRLASSVTASLSILTFTLALLLAVPAERTLSANEFAGTCGDAVCEVCPSPPGNCTTGPCSPACVCSGAPNNICNTT